MQQPRAGPTLSQDPPTNPPQPTLAEATRVWLTVGLTGFGGPAGQIAILHREVVETRRWVPEDRFLHALNFCTLLPGPEAQQLATYLGWLLHGTRGGLIAGSLFILPGALLLFVLSWLYAVYGKIAALQAVFGTLKAVVVIIVLDALRRIGGRALKTPLHWALAVGAFIALAAFGVPFPAVVLTAGVIGAWAGAGRGANAALTEARQPSIRRTVTLAVAGVVAWWTPFVVVAATLGNAHLFAAMARFFAQAAVVTFGGAYAVLAYVGQHAVGELGWIMPGEMLDGLALAETTPGPLILVLQFVGFLAGYRQGSPIDGLAGGALGTGLTLWMTFVPSFLFVLVAAPYVERLRGQPRLAGALSGITAAVVGVIASLALWFAIHALFARSSPVGVGPATVLVPEWTSVSGLRLAIAAAAAIAMFRFRVGMLGVLAGALVVGVVAWLAGVA